MVLKGIYIGGDWQKSPQDMEVVNPYNGETITSVPCADGTHATAAIQSAADAFATFKNTP